jgi:hypothetical protein
MCSDFWSVLRIYDILVWIRIRICGSMYLTNGSGSVHLTNESGSGSRRPKYIRIRPRIRIRSTALLYLIVYSKNGGNELGLVCIART